MARCPSCGSPYSDASEIEAPLALGVPVAPTRCPGCGHPLPAAKTAFESGGGIIAEYFRELWLLHTKPGEFFRAMPLRGGLGRPLAFALVTHWLGSATGHLWNQLLGQLLGVGSSMSSLFKVFGDVSDIDNPGRSAQYAALKERFTSWIWGTGSVIADPFFSLFKILFTSMLVYIGARILVSPSQSGARDRGPAEITYESALRIVCFGMAPAILGILPVFGSWLAWLLTAVVTVIGAREVYRVGWNRAMTIAFFPQVIFISFVALFFAMMMLVAVKFAMSF